MAKNYIDNLSEKPQGMQEKAEQGHLADQDAARLSQRHWPRWQEGSSLPPMRPIAAA